MTEIVFRVRPDDHLAIDDLITMFHPNNSQERTKVEMDGIMNAILVDGFTAENIIVNPWNNKIVSGHGRVQACWNLGYRGGLPVIYRRYESEDEHRFAMLRWNRARGHQDPDLEQKEIAALMKFYSSDELQTHLAYTDDEFRLLASLASVSSSPQSESEKEVARPEIPSYRANWPWLRVAIPPDAMALYVSFLEDLPGHDDAWKFEQMLLAVDEVSIPKTAPHR